MVDEFEKWLRELEDDTQDSVLVSIRLLQEHGPALSRPYADTLKNSKLVNLKELRMQHKGEPYRVLYAFDPKRSAILLLGGNKSTKKSWYKTNIQIAEKRYKKHLTTLKDD